MRENTEINLHHDRFELSRKLQEENCFMLAYEIETGLTLSGYNLTQSEYDDLIRDCISE